LQGYAELDDVCEALDITIKEEVIGDSSTIGGLLCSLVSILVEVDIENLNYLWHDM
jgi:hypothetical protein